MKPDIVRRYGHNPILTKAEIPYPVDTVHNAAVVKHGDEYIMLLRSHLRTGRPSIGESGERSSGGTSNRAYGSVIAVRSGRQCRSATHQRVFSKHFPGSICAKIELVVGIKLSPNREATSSGKF